MKNHEKICRTCLKDDSQLFSLNIKLEDEIQGKKMLEFLLGNGVLDSDDFCEICELCRRSLTVSYFFKKLCLVSEKKIKEHIQSTVEADPLAIIEESAANPPLKEEETIAKDVNSSKRENIESTEESEKEGNSETVVKSIEQRKGKIVGHSCRKCDIKFPDSSTYMRHYRVEHRPKSKKMLQLEEGKQYPKTKTCLRCKITFPNNSAYMKHYRDVHRKSLSAPMTCTRCEITLPNFTAYHRHCKDHHGNRERTVKSHEKQEGNVSLGNEKEIYCRKCELIFPNNPAYKKHYYEVHCAKKKVKSSKVQEDNLGNGKQMYCRRCKIRFPDLTAYMQHWEREHKKQKDGDGAPRESDWKVGPNGEKLIGCRLCRITFPNKLEHRRHYRIMHKKKEKTTVCEDCGKTVRLFAIYSHRASHRGKSFFCSICGGGFTLKANLRHHMRIHSKQKNFICHYCNKSFIHWNSRKVHIRTRHEMDKEEIFECFICGMKTHWKSGMALHMRRHKKDYKHKCSFCEKEFITGRSLREHSVVHTGEKNVICTICSKAFGTTGYLRQHMVTHADARDYECEFCSKTFTQCHVLRSHMRAFHPEQPLPPPGTIMKKNLRNTKGSKDFQNFAL